LPKEKMTREEAYIVIAFFFFFGIILVSLGYLWGLILVFVSVFLLLNIPKYRDMFVEILQALYSTAKGVRRELRRTRPIEYNQAISSSVADTNLARIVDILKNCPLPTKFRHDPENDAETWMSAQLVHEFPDHKRQQFYPQYHQRFDIEIGDIGVEVKLPQGSRDLATLRGQMQIYLKRFKYVIALILNYYHINPELLDDFKKDMENYDGRVIVIERQLR